MRDATAGFCSLLDEVIIDDVEKELEDFSEDALDQVRKEPCASPRVRVRVSLALYGIYRSSAAYTRRQYSAIPGLRAEPAVALHLR